jgi:proteasome lid subunit RPN8/RPN11
VRQHASAFLPSILSDSSGNGIGLNPLDETFHPVGWRWIDVPPYKTFTPKSGSDWRVRIHPDVFEVMMRQRSAALPNETGGYLYGGWDAAARVVSVVFSSGLPPGTTATSASLALGPAGATEDERRLERATRGRLTLLGSWHSHTGGCASLSATDLKTLGGHAAVDQLQFVPTVGIVVADGAQQVFLEI